MPLRGRFQRTEMSSIPSDTKDRITSATVPGSHNLIAPASNTDRIRPDSDHPDTESTFDQLPKRSDRYGLHFLNEPQFKADQESRNQLFFVDVVAVHGLNGDAYDTWTSKKTGKMWLYHFLPQELPGARIFSFGYPSEIGLTLATEKVEDFARSLLNGLKASRYSAEVSYGAYNYTLLA